jgi:GDP-L-fucose synthase
VVVLDAALHTGVNRLLFIGSSGIYPKVRAGADHRRRLLAGPLEP